MKFLVLSVGIILLLGCLLLLTSLILDRKKIGPLWLQKLWGKYSKFVEWAWAKSKPFLKTLWGKVWLGLKWLWDHKKEKRVWVSAAALGVTLLLLLGVISIFQVVNKIKGGLATGTDVKIGISGITWFFIAVFGCFFVLLEIVAWVLVWQGIFLKSKTLWKIHAWIAVGIGAILLIGSLLFIPWGKGASVATNWSSGALDWYSQTVPYPWAVAPIFCLIIIWMIFKKKGSAASAKSGRGGEKEGGIMGGLLGIGVAILLIYLLYAAVTDRSEQKDKALHRFKTEAREFSIMVKPDEEYPVELSLHMALTPKLVDLNRKVWVRIEGQPRTLFKTGDPAPKGNLGDKRFIYFQSADGKPLVLEIKIEPNMEGQRQ